MSSFDLHNAGGLYRCTLFNLECTSWGGGGGGSMVLLHFMEI